MKKMKASLSVSALTSLTNSAQCSTALNSPDLLPCLFAWAGRDAKGFYPVQRQVPACMHVYMLRTWRLVAVRRRWEGYRPATGPHCFAIKSQGSSWINHHQYFIGIQWLPLKRQHDVIRPKDRQSTLLADDYTVVPYTFNLRPTLTHHADTPISICYCPDWTNIFPLCNFLYVYTCVTVGSIGWNITRLIASWNHRDLYLYVQRNQMRGSRNICWFAMQWKTYATN